MTIEIKDWWADAGLWMQSAIHDEPPTAVASGSLAEIVNLARSANREEQDILFITSAVLDRNLPPSQVRMLTERADLPVVI